MRILKLVRLGAGPSAQSSRGILLNTDGVILERRKNRQTRGAEIYDLRSRLSAVLQLPPSGNERRRVHALASRSTPIQEYRAGPTAAVKIPTATYRLQFTPEFGFGHARAALSYLHDLGISDIYASPIFHARSGSAHGYDVVDSNRLNPELGSQRGVRSAG